MAAIYKRSFFVLSFFSVIILLSLVSIINYHNNYNLINLRNNSDNKNLKINNNIIVDEEVKSTNITYEKVENNDNAYEEVKDKVENIVTDTLLASFDIPVNLEKFSELRNRMELHTALWDLVFGKYEANNDSNEFKKYKNLLINNTEFLSVSDKDDLTNEKKLLASIHQSLYPWLYNHHFKSISDIISSSHGKGLVICTGDKHFKYARSTVDIFRNVLKCDLPIEIIYNGKEDLSKENRKIISKYKNIYLTDISDYFDKEIVDISGWAIKPFAILSSRFEEVILIDADVVYLRDPRELFEDEGYLEKGSLFFRDRTINPGPHPGSEWLRSWMTNPLPETKELRFYNEKTMHEMESSTVVLNKTKNILGLLATCKLNEKKIREDVVYKFVYGDKETFWIGFDMARQHYNLNSVPCTFFGKVREDFDGKKICGHIGHMLENGKFMFWNGHIVKNKGLPENRLELIDFDSYIVDDNYGDWTPDFACLRLKGKKDPTPLNQSEREILNTILDREKEKHFIIPV